MQATRYSMRFAAIALLIMSLVSFVSGCAVLQDGSPAAPPAPPKPQVEPPKPPPEPQIKMSLGRESVAQGELIIVRCTFEGGYPTQATASGLNAKANMHPENGKAYGLIPVGVGTAPGVHKITVEAAWPSGVKKSAEATVTITKTAFQVSRITATKEQTDNITEQKLAQDSVKVRAAKASSAPVKMWATGFQAPLEAKITTGYGHVRYVNGVETWRHSGIDFGAPLGTKVAACADGKVVLATTLNGTGNTVILDHGLGLFSSYGHMSALTVKPGDQVKKGQTVGLVGSTGFSTGPHLHWTVTIGLTSIDPFSLIRYAVDLGF